PVQDRRLSLPATHRATHSAQKLLLEVPAVPAVFSRPLCARPQSPADTQRELRDPSACDMHHSIPNCVSTIARARPRWLSRNCPDAASSSTAGISAPARSSQSKASAASQTRKNSQRRERWFLQVQSSSPFRLTSIQNKNGWRISRPAIPTYDLAT